MQFPNYLYLFVWLPLLDLPAAFMLNLIGDDIEGSVEEHA
jgi:hypothetical protein